MRLLDEFKQFAIKGNVLDLAIGVIIGGAFGKIVESVVADLIMPCVAGIIGGKLDFSGMFIVLGHIPDGVPSTLEALKKAQVPVLAYGNFITISVNFLILAGVVFFMVKQVNRLRKVADPTPPPVSEEIVLLREIRDSLKNKAADTHSSAL